MSAAIHDKARELGFIIKKGPTKFSGYVLKRLATEVSKKTANHVKRARKATIDDEIIDDEEPQSHVDDYPLGDDYRASLADIEDYLESYADDVAAGRVKASDEDDAEPEIEISVKLQKVKPPSPQKLAASLRGRADAAEIQAMMKSAKVDIKITTDIKFEQRALQSRENHKRNWQHRINPDGRHDRNEHDEQNDRDLREYLADVEREHRNFIPPDPTWTPESAMPMATDMADVAVVKVKRRVSKKV
jgi:hypothetical protein